MTFSDHIFYSIVRRSTQTFDQLARTRTMADADWANSTLLRPHCHGVCLIEYDAGKDLLTDMQNWLWDTYRCTPKTSSSEAMGRWAEPLYLSHGRLTGLILYVFKFPCWSSCRAFSRQEWRVWLSAMKCKVTYIFATWICAGIYSATRKLCTPYEGTKTKPGTDLQPMSSSQRLNNASQSSLVTPAATCEGGATFFNEKSGEHAEKGDVGATWFDNPKADELKTQSYAKQVPFRRQLQGMAPDGHCEAKHHCRSVSGWHACKLQYKGEQGIHRHCRRHRQSVHTTEYKNNSVHVRCDWTKQRRGPEAIY